MDALHNSAIGGHSGSRATYHIIKMIFYWPRLRRQVENYVAECPICQVSKSDHVHVPGLLESLPIPDMAWTHITMDFIEGLPRSKNKDAILVVVDRLTKYAHFLGMSRPYTVQQVAQLFMDNVFKLHGMPTTIITDRDKIFTSKLFQEIFNALKVILRFSTSYHPQTDGETERVNQCLEAYLRCMGFQEPQNSYTWLAMAEWWYNTTYHTLLKLTPFQALYGYAPPQVGELSLPGNLSDEARMTVEEKERMLRELKLNLQQAQNKIKQYADRRRTERIFQMGDMVYLKMQPYRQNAFGLRGSLKLRAKFYGSFRVLEKVGRVAYKLQLPEDSMIHPVFNVS